MSLIKNKDELATSKQRSDALEILEAGLQAIDTEEILRSKIMLEEGGALCIEDTGFQCNFYDRIFFIGIGKCAFDGARVIEQILGDKLTDGVVIDVKGGILERIKSFTGTHPYPSEMNMTATKSIVEMVQGVTERDLILVLISGGGSSLLCLPHEISCEALIEITKNLTDKGANIYELNTVRKHLSEIQGGNLAKLCFPAQIVSLIFSDVLGNDISVIASGPTVIDQSTILDAKKVLDKYGISSEADLIETPKEQKYFSKVKNVLVCSNADALNAMKTKAENLGFSASIETTTLSGIAREVGKGLGGRRLNPKTCLLFGGETTVEIKGKGSGGRNQEVALSALPYLAENHVLLTAASDGYDNTEVAGAIVDSELFMKSKTSGHSSEEYLERNDSFDFFKDMNDGAILTGRLGSNVSDLIIMLNGNGKQR